MAFVASFASMDIEYSLSIGSFTKFIPKIEIIPEEVNPTSLSFVGDVLLARRVETYLDAYGSTYVYSSLPEVSSSTVLVGNFESSIPATHTQTPDLTFSFSVDAIHIPALHEYGFKYMSVANNHSADKGLEGLVHTQQVLEIKGIHPVGSPIQLSTTTIEYIELEGQSIALIGVYAVNISPTNEEIQKVFESTSELSDIQIVYIHWGIEYQPIHSSAQQKLAHIMIDAGADAVIGHHPHVVQDIELYEGVPIFYSLGNFIFDQYFSKEVQEGLWIELTIKEEVMEYTLKGITSIGSRSVPRFMSSYENDLFLRTLSKKSTNTLQEEILLGKITQ